MALKEFFKNQDRPTLNELLRCAEAYGKFIKKEGKIPGDFSTLKWMINQAFQSRAGLVGGRLAIIQSRILTARVKASELEAKGKSKEATEQNAMIAGLRKDFKKINSEAILLQDALTGLKKIETDTKEAIQEKLEAKQQDILAEARQNNLHLSHGVTTIKPKFGGLF